MGSSQRASRGTKERCRARERLVYMVELTAHRYARGRSCQRVFGADPCSVRSRETSTRAIAVTSPVRARGLVAIAWRIIFDRGSCRRAASRTPPSGPTTGRSRISRGWSMRTRFEIARHIPPDPSRAAAACPVVVQPSRLPGQARRLHHNLFLDRHESPCRRAFPPILSGSRNFRFPDRPTA